MLKPEDCLRFNECSASLCPIDPDIDLRIWFPDEDVCKARQHNKHRWIRKQRAIVRRGTPSYHDGRPITRKRLFDASRPKQLTDEQRNALRERLAKARMAQKS